MERQKVWLGRRWGPGSVLLHPRSRAERRLEVGDLSITGCREFGARGSLCARGQGSCLLQSLSNEMGASHPGLQFTLCSLPIPVFPRNCLPAPSCGPVHLCPTEPSPISTNPHLLAGSEPRFKHRVWGQPDLA